MASTINFKNNVKIKNMQIKNSKPLKLVSESSEISKLSIAPKAATPQAAPIAISGHFSKCELTLKDSTRMDCTPDFKLDKKMKLDCPPSSSAVVTLSGDFSNVPTIEAVSAVTLEAPPEAPMQKAAISFNSPKTEDSLILKGNLSDCSLNVTGGGQVGLYSSLDKLFIDNETTPVNLTFFGDNVNIGSSVVVSPVYVSGDEAIVDKFYDESIGGGIITIVGVYKETSFSGGRSTLSTSLGLPGSYELSINIKQGNEIVTLNDKFLILVIS